MKNHCKKNPCCADPYDCKPPRQFDAPADTSTALTPAEKAGVGDGDTLKAAAEAGWNACRRQVYLLSEDYTERTHAVKGTETVEGNFYRGQYDVAKSFARAFNAFEARDCDFFKQIDFSSLSTTKPAQGDGELRKALEIASDQILSMYRTWVADDYTAMPPENSLTGKAYYACRAALAAQGDDAQEASR